MPVRCAPEPAPDTSWLRVPLGYPIAMRHIAFCVSPAARDYDDPRTLHTYRGDGIPRTAGGWPYEPLTGWDELRKV